MTKGTRVYIKQAKHISDVWREKSDESLRNILKKYGKEIVK